MLVSSTLAHYVQDSREPRLLSVARGLVLTNSSANLHCLEVHTSVEACQTSSWRLCLHSFEVVRFVRPRMLRYHGSSEENARFALEEAIYAA